MYNPTVGRWMEEDPIDFKAGDADKYRYVENDATNATDPSGLDGVYTPRLSPWIWEGRGPEGSIIGGTISPRVRGMDEKEALRLLKDQIKAWQDKGWGFPAALLQHFIDKKGPAPYVPTKKDIEEVQKESRDMLANIIQTVAGAKLNSGRIKEGTPFKIQVGTPTKPAEVRWGSLQFPYIFMDLAFLGKDVFMMKNEYMFAAYYGARLRMNAKILTWKKISAGPAITPTRGYRITVQANVTLSDTYEFAEPGPLNVRLSVPEYAAAHFLQVVDRKYKPFDHSMTFEMDFKDLEILANPFGPVGPSRFAPPLPLNWLP